MRSLLIKIYILYFIISIIVYKHRTVGKVYEKCELARTLREIHLLSIDEIGIWVCIAQHQSGLNSSAFTGTSKNGGHGLFQISDEFWCSPPGKGWACGITCDKLRDDDLTDDLKCLKIIYEEHQGISGDGYNAWSSYQPFCKARAQNYVQECFFTDFDFNHQKLDRRSLVKFEEEPKPKQEKIYENCELAWELFYRHHVPILQIPMWVCIAKHESNLNTTAIGHLNKDGSGDHGLFQISDQYWCSPPGYGWGCGLSCNKYTDTDITDDVDCIRKIYDEHEKLSGDGFNAWATYDLYCKGRADEYIKGCFDASDYNTIVPNIDKVSTKRSYPLHSSSDKGSKHKSGKVYKPCELAEELRVKHMIPEDHIATWMLQL